MKIIEFIIASFLIIILPGQDFLYLVSQSVNINKKAGLFTALGLAAGNIVTISAIAFGITPYIINNILIMQLIKLFAVLYILFLAYKTFTFKKNNEINNELEIRKAEKKNNLKKFLTGVTLNVLNIKAWLFMLIFFPQFLNPNSENPLLDIAILGLIFIIMVIIIFSTIAIIASKLSKILILNNKNNVLNYISGTLLVVIAIIILLQ